MLAKMKEQNEKSAIPTVYIIRVIIKKKRHMKKRTNATDMTYEQQAFLLDPMPHPRTKEQEARKARSGTFSDNMKLPIHRWFRYSAGFSAEWVTDLVRSFCREGTLRVLDPFAGSGTTLLAAARAGAAAVGYESHPFVAEIARAKLLWHTVHPHELITAAAEVIKESKKFTTNSYAVAPLLEKCYSEETLSVLFGVRRAIENYSTTSVGLKELLKLALTAILRSCSHVGTAQWQYVLPNKRKSNVSSPIDALISKAQEMAEDIAWAAKEGFGKETLLLEQDARQPSVIPAGSINLVVTSPPYPNNYDYADATRLEMTFWGEIATWGDLQKTVRQHIVRSCSQHSAAERLQLDELLALSELDAIRDNLSAVCRELEAIRLTKGGRKTYHTMIAAYYADMSKVFRSLRNVCADGADLCFVIGDSAPYGVHAPADNWLARLAIDAGFHSASFEKLRDRNIKWKNRKHTVPLQEGRLWLKG